MKRKPRRATRIVALALASIAAPVIAVGCGGSVPSPQSEGMTAVPPEDPVAALDQAEREVQVALGLYPTPPMQALAQPTYGGVQSQQTPYAAPPPPAPPAAPAPTTTAPAPAERKAETEAKRAERVSPGADEASPVSQDPCMTACRALQSMGRAATHLCELAADGEGHARCANAKDRVRRAEDLVRQRCPSCAG